MLKSSTAFIVWFALAVSVPITTLIMFLDFSSTPASDLLLQALAYLNFPAYVVNRVLGPHSGPGWGFWVVAMAANFLFYLGLGFAARALWRRVMKKKP